MIIESFTPPQTKIAEEWFRLDDGEVSHFGQNYHKVLFLLFCPGIAVQSLTANTPTVLVSHPQAHSFNAALQLTGTARPNQTVKLYAMTSGFLQQLKADIGDFVKAGQVLAVLENPELHRDQQRLEALLREKNRGMSV